MKFLLDLSIALLYLSLLHVNNAFLVPLSRSLNIGQKRSTNVILNMGIKAVHNYDSSFTLSSECSALLSAYLNHPDMEKEVCRQYQLANAKFIEGELFQPVPYSPNTPHGMPPSFEKYFLNDEFAIVNIPPVVMFKAKIFKPSRLCAVFKVDGRTEAQKAEMAEQREIAIANILNRKMGPTSVIDTIPDTAGWENIGSIIRENFEKGDGVYDDDEDLDSLVV